MERISEAIAVVKESYGRQLTRIADALTITNQLEKGVSRELDHIETRIGLMKNEMDTLLIRQVIL